MHLKYPQALPRVFRSDDGEPLLNPPDFGDFHYLYLPIFIHIMSGAGTAPTTNILWIQATFLKVRTIQWRESLRHTIDIMIEKSQLSIPCLLEDNSTVIHLGTGSATVIMGDLYGALSFLSASIGFACRQQSSKMTER